MLDDTGGPKKTTAGRAFHPPDVMGGKKKFYRINLGVAVGPFADESRHAVQEIPRQQRIRKTAISPQSRTMFARGLGLNRFQPSTSWTGASDSPSKNRSRTAARSWARGGVQ